MLSERKQVWGHRNGYFGKVFIDQTQGPEFEPWNPHFKKPDNVECACTPSCQEKSEVSWQLAGQPVYLNWQTPEPCQIKKRWREIEKDSWSQPLTSTHTSSHTWIHTTNKQINQEPLQNASFWYLQAPSNTVLVSWQCCKQGEEEKEIGKRSSHSQKSSTKWEGLNLYQPGTMETKSFREPGGTPYDGDRGPTDPTP